ncbi:MAG: transposase [Nanoarchaeota archaeon]
MQALDVVLALLNKKIVKKVSRIRRGPKGYGLLLIFRLLLYSVLIEYFSTKQVIRHLRKNKRVLKLLGFKTVPDRRTIDRWRRKFDYELCQIIKLTGDNYLQLNNSEWTVLDSTPIPDADDAEAMTGYSSMGEFIGFKLHASCDEFCVPLRATFTAGNVHDSQEAFMLLAPTQRVGGDSAYDFQELKEAVKEQDSKGYFVHNPRREGKDAKKPTPELLKKVRVIIEQLNSVVKLQVMKEYWTKIKGLKAKAVFALTAVLALQALAIFNLKKWGYPSIRISEVRC